MKVKEGLLGWRETRKSKGRRTCLKYIAYMYENVIMEHICTINKKMKKIQKFFKMCK
jgi:hypothetical protein